MYDHILVPLDGSHLAERVLPHLVSLSKTFDAEVTLLRVVSKQIDSKPSNMVNPMDWEMRKSEAKAYLNSIKKILKKSGVASNVRIEEGKPAKQIINFAQRESVELIILCSHGESGLSEWNINSTVQKVLLRAFMPVMIIRAYKEPKDEIKPKKYKRVFLPLDGSKRAECILPLAEAISRNHDSEIVIAHIVEEPKLPRQTPLSEEEKNLINQLVEKNLEETKKYLNTLKTQFPEHKTEVLIQSSKNTTVALHNLVDKEKIDLVLLSAHGLSGQQRWPYGNIALNFIAFGTTPMIIIQDLTREKIKPSEAEKIAQESKGH